MLITVIIILILIGITGLAYGFHEALDSRIEELPLAIQKSKYWNPVLSAPRKWRNGKQEDGEAFLGSSTLLVSFVEGGKLLAELLISLPLVGLAIALEAWWVYIACRVLFTFCFYVIYPYKRKKS